MTENKGHKFHYKLYKMHYADDTHAQDMQNHSYVHVSLLHIAR